MSIYKKYIKNEPRWKDIYETCPEVPSISKGQMTLKVPITVFHDNRKRLLKELRKGRPHAIVVIQAAGSTCCLAKRTYVQDSKFFWSFGYQKSAAIGIIDVFKNKSYLIIPRLSCDLECCKKQAMRREIKKQFWVNGVYYLEELESLLEYLWETDCSEFLILDYQKPELPACMFKYEVESNELRQVMHNLMAYKTEKEIKILCYIAKNLESALIQIIHRLRPGMTHNQLEAWYCFFMTYKSGFDQLTFCIFSGSDKMDHDSYIRRSYFSRRERVFKEGEVCIIEAGASYFGHKLSLGIVIPVSENFNRFQKKAYEAMLGMRQCIFQDLKVGLPMECLRRTAEKYLLKFLVESDLLRGTVEGAFENGVARLLIPSRLVRSMDVGCKDLKELELGKSYLIQSGCYFAKRTLDEVYQNSVFVQYLTPNLRDYEDIVVKVSDPVIITTDGFRFLSNMPRDWCIIRDMRLEDEFKKSDSTIEVEKQNLMVRPSLFTVCP
ncbi:unnamed protein product [Nezara viridula]|uniref:Xaa-Pro dipeptidase n=1 Tax=Nezara viridula TaxID=85310 RepID=A0A9P0HLK6_NEZVI|nr:unnamed protein product [Nezara viridula]